jgi:hypothetical protein
VNEINGLVVKKCFFPILRETNRERELHLFLATYKIGKGNENIKKIIISLHSFNFHFCHLFSLIWEIGKSFSVKVLFHFSQSLFLTIPSSKKKLDLLIVIAII